MINLRVSQAKKGTKTRVPTNWIVVTFQAIGSLPGSVVNFILSFFNDYIFNILECFEMIMINGFYFGSGFDSGLFQVVL